MILNFLAICNEIAFSRRREEDTEKKSFHEDKLDNLIRHDDCALIKTELHTEIPSWESCHWTNTDSGIYKQTQKLHFSSASQPTNGQIFFFFISYIGAPPGWRILIFYYFTKIVLFLSLQWNFELNLYAKRILHERQTGEKEDSPGKYVCRLSFALSLSVIKFLEKSQKCTWQRQIKHKSSPGIVSGA